MSLETRDDWKSYHIYYHEDLSRVVLGLVYPTILTLWKARRIDGFFFVRYGLGGPHLRLRVRPAPSCSEIVDWAVRKAAEEFLIQSPSTASLNEEALRRVTESILSTDPHEIDNTIYPDNTFIFVAFRPEKARYGGPDLLPHSLDFFTVSSIVALDFLTRFREEPRSRQLILAFRLLLRQALGFAADPDELIALLGYGVLSWGEAMPTLLEKGDRVFTAQRKVLCNLFSQGISELSPGACTDDTVACLGKAAELLSRTVGRDDRRRGIGISQLHMTATRLGLSNLEEVYISRLLSSSAQSVFAEDPHACTQLAEILRNSQRSTEPGLTPGVLIPWAFTLLDSP